MNRFLAASLLLLLSATPTAFALDEAQYTVATEPWDAGLGHHRAVVLVERKADTVTVRIPWRRRDHDPERKQIIVLDAATQQRITNVACLHLDRFEAVLAFQPHTVPGQYFICYLPYKPQPAWGNYDGNYLPPKDTADPDWKAHLPQDPASLPTASLLRLEARSDFDSFYPMEVVATPEETQALLQRSATSAAFTLQQQGPTNVSSSTPSGLLYLLFPEDRRFPIRMTDELPLRWIKSGPTNTFVGEAQRNEFFVFQIGAWAAQTNLDAVDVEFAGEIAPWLNCFNTSGTNWDGQPFHRTLAVPQGKVQAFWIGVDVPADAEPGDHHATVIIHPPNAPSASVALTLKVLPTELADRGDADLWRLARLRWLNSTLGLDTDPTSAYSPLVVSNRSVSGRGFQVTFAPSPANALPSSIRSHGVELLANPVTLFIDGVGPSQSAPPPQSSPSLTSNGSGQVRVVSERTTPAPSAARPGAQSIALPLNSPSHRAQDSVPPIPITSETIIEFDGTLSSALRLKPARDFKTTNLRLEIPLRPEVAAFFMGIGLPACRTPSNYAWHWKGPYNSFWIGNADAGLHVKLLGSTYEGPMQNLYHPKPPPSWFNEGQGGVTLTNGPKGELLVQVDTGPFELKAGDERIFRFSLLVTPVKTLDTAAHFRARYWHSNHNIPSDINTINVHHATTPNPFINYPFLALDRLRDFCRTNQAGGKKVKIYYTVRELTTHLPELWALRSLGDEVLAGGRGGGFPWLREHLATHYTTAWYNIAEGGVADAAVLTSGASRWYNFYVEGLNWLVRNVPIDGLYLDDVAYDRTILKRMRHVLDRARPGCLIDLHSNTAFSIGPANQYTEFFPYVDRLWFGESFKYDAMSPVQWLVECSGIPFGLMGDMLQDGGNRWRGMLFGMTPRLPWPSSEPRPVWKVWDDFGIDHARMLGWWEPNCPVRTDRDDVLATTYVKPGQTLIALASWAPEKTDVHLQINWQALGLDPDKARLSAPEIKDFQPAKQWRLDDPIPVDPKRGWLIYLAN